MVGRIFSLIVCLVFLVGCVETVPIDKLDGKVVLYKEPSGLDIKKYDLITVRDSSSVNTYRLYKYDSEKLKVGDTIKIK